MYVYDVGADLIHNSMAYWVPAVLRLTGRQTNNYLGSNR